jgi:CheY-like chemotaxis protein
MAQEAPAAGGPPWTLGETHDAPPPSQEGGEGVAPSGSVVHTKGNTGLLRIGDVLGGVFEIRALIGEGGMGQVFEARDRLLNRRVAIKVAWPDAVSNVRAEALALAALRHPSMIAIHALNCHGGLDYVVMERIYGMTLEAHIERRHADRTRFSIDEVVDVLVGIAEGLAVVHRAGMAHRDVKPANVMLAPGNRIVLTDFGIFQAEIHARDRTARKEVSGSPSYMAPETIRCTVAPGEAYLVDIYALGVVAFELLTDKLPFPSESTLEVLRMHLTEAPPDPTDFRSDTPPKLAALVRELLTKDPKARPQDVGEIAWQLRHMCVESVSADERFNVVIAEDDPYAATILAAIVTQAAPEALVRIAGDGREALELVRRHVPHLLVVDLHLPKLSGVEVCTHLRGTRFADRCTILSTSAHADPGEVELLRTLGFGRFASKGDEIARRLPALVTELRWRRVRSRRAVSPRG